MTITEKAESSAWRIPPSVVTTVFFFFVLFGVNSRFTPKIGGSIPFPYAICGVSIFLLMFIRPVSIPWKDIRIFGAIFLVGVATIFLSPYSVSHLGDRLRGLIMFLYTLTLALTMFHQLRTLSLSRLSVIFGGSVFFILIGSFLELTTPLRDVSQTVRMWMGESGTVAAGMRDIRDLSTMGGIRPNFFAAETSVLALTVSYCLVAWYLASSSPYRTLWCAMGILAALAIIRSPGIGIALLVCAMAFIFLNPGAARRNGKRASRRVMARTVLISAAMLVVTALIGALFFDQIKAFVADRVISIVTGQDHSFLLRVAIPAVVTQKVLSSWPLFGVGVGGYHALSNMVGGFLVHFGLDIQSGIAANMLAGGTVPNAFFGFFVQFGLVGGAIIVWQMLRFARRYAPRGAVLALPGTMVFALMETTATGFFIWLVFVTLVLILGKVSDRRASLLPG